MEEATEKATGEPRLDEDLRRRSPVASTLPTAAPFCRKHSPVEPGPSCCPPPARTPVIDVAPALRRAWRARAYACMVDAARLTTLDGSSASISRLTTSQNENDRCAEAAGAAAGWSPAGWWWWWWWRRCCWVAVSAPSRFAISAVLSAAALLVPRRAFGQTYLVVRRSWHSVT